MDNQVILEVEYRLDPQREPLAARLEGHLRRQPGLITSHCQRSVDGSRLVCRAQWESIDAGRSGLDALVQPQWNGGLKALRFFA